MNEQNTYESEQRVSRLVFSMGWANGVCKKQHYAYKFLARSALFCCCYCVISFHISGSFKSPLIHADHYRVRRDLNSIMKRTSERTNKQSGGKREWGSEKMGRQQKKQQRARLYACVWEREREKLEFNIIFIFISHTELHMPLLKE